MKRIVSMLAVALLTTIVGAGCGKWEKCSDANDNKKGCSDAANFKEGLKCKWVPGAEEGKGTCEEDKAQETDLQKANKICNEHHDKGQDECTKAKPGKGFKCEYKEEKCNAVPEEVKLTKEEADAECAKLVPVDTDENKAKCNAHKVDAEWGCKVDGDKCVAEKKVV